MDAHPIKQKEHFQSIHEMLSQINIRARGIENANAKPHFPVNAI